MKAEQISVFVENLPGRLAHIIRMLAEADINIRALSLADSSDFGILRMILCNQDKAEQILKSSGLTTGITSVVAVEMPDQPGALDSVLSLMSSHGINVEYMYACARRNNELAVMIFRFDKLDQAIPLLQANGHTIIPGSVLCAQMG